MALLDLVRKLPVIKQIGELYTENRILRDHLYATNNINLSNIPGTFSQIIDPGTGNCKGFFYRCLCQTEYQLLNVYEFLRNEIHECPTCKRSFNLLLSIDAIESDGTFKMKAQEIAARLSNLPVRPFLKATPRPPFMPVGDQGEAESAGWDGVGSTADGRGVPPGVSRSADGSYEPKWT